MTNTQPVLIRRLKIDELDAIQRLYAQQIEGDQNPITALRIHPKQHAREMRCLRQQLITQQRYFAYVATIKQTQNDEQIIGYTAAILQDQASIFQVQAVGAIDELWVLPEFRNRGIGHNLLDALCEELKQNGVEWITTHFPNQIHLIDFFKKLGFQQKNIEMQAHLGE